MSPQKLIPGKFVWFEHISRDARSAQAFYRQVLGWNVEPLRRDDGTYEMITAAGTTIGGYRTPRAVSEKARWIGCVSVEDVDGSAKAAVNNGGRIIEQPFDMPEVGRLAWIADPLGAELKLYTSATGDPPDVKQSPHGTWLWNELHTSNPVQALAFYERVIGFTHKALDMGPGGTYYIIGRNGVDRGGVTHWLQPGDTPHWLPYVAVDDVDATAAKVVPAGGKICFGPDDIPNAGRFAVVQDPTGAALAVMKPLPRS